MKHSQSEQTIFLEARSLDSEDHRRAFLDDACAGDLTLRQRVEALLNAEANLGSFLDRPPDGLQPQHEPVGRTAIGHIGESIGRYKLLEVIGEGGCGVVYMAEQIEPMRRRVALKIIKLGMDTRSVAARFEAERQALALMDHPNIARVLDGGATETGRPYFVMELVRGVRITEYCDEALLTTEARLRLFIDVCNAVQHAHQKGIIHRDLKPSNILVTVNDGVAVPKVIDFGIAKAIGQSLTHKTIFTRFHAFIGTPAYTSPEQAEMSSVDIDTRSDIYSLGVLLYELLTGRTPFDGEQLLKSGLDELRRVIRDEEPAAPSNRLSTLGVAEATELSRKWQRPIPELARAVRGDLDWIILKCLEKDRSRRYETASSLTADIQRHLDNEPIAARPPSALYRSSKWIQRNRLLFASAAAVAAALLIGSGVSISQYIAKSRAYGRAVKAEAQQNQLREDAQRERRVAELAAARSSQVAEFLKEMLRNVAPGVARGRDTTLLRDVLDETASRIEAQLAGQPEVQADLYFTLGRTYADLTLHAKAETMFEQSISRFRTSSGLDQRMLAEALGQLAVAQATQGKAVAAQPNADEALRLARQLNDPEVLADILRSKARSLDPDQDVPEAVPYLEEALALQRKTAQNRSAEGDILRQLGGALAWGTNIARAEACLREALSLHQQVLGTNDLTLAQDWFNLSQIAVKKPDYAEAERAIRHALDIARPLLNRSHQSRVDYTAFLAHFLILQGKWDDAETFLKEEARALPEDLRYNYLLGTFYARRHSWLSASAELLRSAQSFSDPNYVPLDPVVAMLKAGRTNECLGLWHQAMARSENTRQFDVADKLAKAGLLLPLDPTDLKRAATLADYASTAKSPAWLLPWMSFCKAFADFRRGQFSSAADWASHCRHDANATAPCQAGACFIHALALAYQNQKEAARTAYESGNRLMREASAETGNFEGRWAPWTIADMLREQASEKISGAAAVASTERPLHP